MQLAFRSQVGYDAARFMLAYLVRTGHLVVMTPDKPRPYSLPGADACTASPAAAASLAAAWAVRGRVGGLQPGQQVAGQVAGCAEEALGGLVNYALHSQHRGAFGSARPRP